MARVPPAPMTTIETITITRPLKVSFVCLRAVYAIWCSDFPVSPPKLPSPIAGYCLCLMPVKLRRRVDSQSSSNFIFFIINECTISVGIFSVWTVRAIWKLFVKISCFRASNKLIENKPMQNRNFSVDNSVENWITRGSIGTREETDWQMSFVKFTKNW